MNLHAEMFRRCLSVFILAVVLFFSVNVSAYSPPPSIDPPDTSIDDPCYPGSALDTIPDLTPPYEEDWRHTSTKLFVVTQGPDYHMVHDLVVNPQQDQIIVGKFDYGAVFHKDLEDEDVHAYIYGTDMDDWEYLGRYRTNGDGKVYVDVPQKGTGEYIIKMYAAGDLSEAVGYMTVVEEGRNTVLLDIDGTLTVNDFEIVGDYTNVSQANEYAYSTDLVALYKAKGYQVIFLTARPYWVARDTREWYSVKGFSETTITHFSMDNSTITDAEGYKTDYLNYLIDDAGLNLFRVYGNAASDISAYDNADIPKDETFIIGDEAGNEGTVPVYDDYEEHYNIIADTIICSEDME